MSMSPALCNQLLKARRRKAQRAKGMLMPHGFTPKIEGECSLL